MKQNCTGYRWIEKQSKRKAGLDAQLKESGKWARTRQEQSIISWPRQEEQDQEDLPSQRVTHCHFSVCCFVLVFYFTNMLG